MDTGPCVQASRINSLLPCTTQPGYNGSKEPAADSRRTELPVSLVLPMNEFPECPEVAVGADLLDAPAEGA